MSSPTNIHIEGSEYGQVSLGCDYNGARYHLWLDRSTYQPADSTLYKNPPLGVEYRGAGYFSTRYLDQDGGIGRKIVPLMLAEVPNLAPAFEQSIRDKIAAREAEQQEAARIARIKEAGPDLLAALESLLNSVRSNNAGGEPKTQDQIFAEAGHAAIAAIAKAEGR